MSSYYDDDEDSNLCSPPCSDPLCPCDRKPGHGVWPSEQVDRTYPDPWQEENQ